MQHEVYFMFMVESTSAEIKRYGYDPVCNA